MSYCQPHQARFVIFLLAAAIPLVPLGTSHPAVAHVLSDTATDAKKKPTDPGPVLAVVSLAKQRIWVYGSTGLIAQSPVSTGKPGYRTPAGLFSVVQKRKFHRSNIYWNAPMPYMQRITWSGVTLHVGPVPGYPASHGCIRLPHQFAVKLWGMTKIGARVIVAPNDASVLPIEPLQLPVPKLLPAPEESATAAVNARDQGITAGNLSAQPVNFPAASPNAGSTPGLLNPMERAKLIRERAVADAAAKAKAAKKAIATSALKAAAAESAGAALRASESALAVARARRSAAATVVERTAPQPTAQAELALATADSKVAEAEKKSEDARALETAETAAAIAAAKSASEAEQASREAAADLKAAERGTEPISILVSKKAGRIYIRQSWAPIYEAPVAFKDPEKPVGTHAYLAVAAEGSGANLRWLSASLAASPQARPRTGATALVRGQPVAARSEVSPETAASALDRFELPGEARRFIAERLWVGASLIVTDEGISNETGTYTDFIVLTR